MGIHSVDWDKTRLLHGKSRVYLDGREVLGRQDWENRKKELAARSGGRCENHFGPFRVRCSSEATDPHHIVKRSKKRDDRLENLLHVCRACHRLSDNRKLHFKEKP